MREKLVDGKGNFGSVENDPPAAMRYTEARLTHLGAALMQDMEKDTVDFVPNYDERLTEPTVFPAAFPNLLVNGGTGIAVGMATNMAPHNLGEVIDGVCAQIDRPDITDMELMKYIKGPDFPTGGFICGVEGIKNYFTTGKGSIKLRGRIGVEEMKGNREQLVITEIPFNVNRAALEEQIAANPPSGAAAPPTAANRGRGTSADMMSSNDYLGQNYDLEGDQSATPGPKPRSPDSIRRRSKRRHYGAPGRSP